MAVYRIAGYKNDIIQFCIDSDGGAWCGRGNVVMDETGVELKNFAVAKGIGFAAYFYGCCFWETFFESLDGFATEQSGVGSSVNLTSTAVSITAGAGAGYYAYLTKGLSHETIPLTWAKNRRFKARVRLQTNSDQILWIVNGNYGTDKHVGFKIVNNTIYGSVADGTTEKSDLNCGTFAAEDKPLLEAIFKAGVECRFFVNGVDKGAITSNLPTGGASGDYAYRLLYLRTIANAAEAKSMSLSHWLFLQEPE